jgi:hypothetical protein
VGLASCTVGFALRTGRAENTAGNDQPLSAALHPCQLCPQASQEMRRRAPTPHTSADCLPCCLGSECETGSRPGASPDSHCQPHASPLPQNAIPALLTLSTYAALTSQARPGFNVRLTDRHGSNLSKLAILVSCCSGGTRNQTGCLGATVSRGVSMAISVATERGWCLRTSFAPIASFQSAKQSRLCRRAQTPSDRHGSMRMAEREREA